MNELETDLSEQFIIINTENRTLKESLEQVLIKKIRFVISKRCDSLVPGKNVLERELAWVLMQNDDMSQKHYNLSELRLQSIQNKIKFVKLIHQIETLAENHETEINALECKTH